MLSLCHGILLKVVLALFTTLNWGEGGGDKVCFVNVQKLCNIGWNGLKGFIQDCSYHNVPLSDILCRTKRINNVRFFTCLGLQRLVNFIIGHTEHSKLSRISIG